MSTASRGTSRFSCTRWGLRDDPPGRWARDPSSHLDHPTSAGSRLPSQDRERREVHITRKQNTKQAAVDTTSCPSSGAPEPTLTPRRLSPQHKLPRRVRVGTVGMQVVLRPSLVLGRNLDVLRSAVKDGLCRRDPALALRALGDLRKSETKASAWNARRGFGLEVVGTRRDETHVLVEVHALAIFPSWSTPEVERPRQDTVRCRDDLDEVSSGDLDRRHLGRRETDEVSKLASEKIDESSQDDATRRGSVEARE